MPYAHQCHTRHGIDMILNSVIVVFIIINLMAMLVNSRIDVWYDIPLVLLSAFGSMILSLYLIGRGKNG